MKNSKVILIFILAVFFLKGVFLATSFPIFEGQDESRHYNTVQYFAHLQENATLPTIPGIPDSARDKEDLSTYNFSEEIRHTIQTTQINIYRQELPNLINFTPEFSQINEQTLQDNSWSRLNLAEKKEIAYGSKIYHPIASKIEILLSKQNILVRFFANRIFSVLIGTLVIGIFYLTIRQTGFSEKNSLLLTTIISFQPKFSEYYTTVNYDVFLIIAFALFTLGGVRYVKQGLNWKNISLMLFAIVFGMLTKATAIVLIAVFIFILAFQSYQKFGRKLSHSKFVLVGFFSLAVLLVLIFFNKYLPIGNQKGLGGILASLGRYIAETITLGKFSQTSTSYWGLIGWTDSFFIGHVKFLIWLLELPALWGLWKYFSTKEKLPKFLPEKKYGFFILAMIIALQLGVRLADWQNFDRFGRIELGTPGRYFLPNLAAHIVLVYVGWGMLLAKFKKEKYFDLALKIGLLLMFSLSIYLIFNVIIYRYYLL